MVNFRYIDDTTLMTESEEELKSLLMKVKEKNEKAGGDIALLTKSPIIKAMVFPVFMYGYMRIGL